ncbi:MULTISPECIES: Holliday junction branch migration protein RuvA [Bacillales]|jgi:Holliday junction DNA helicase RuvA|uniref:Holliday junction branch migration complex subunit RuvA n=1 Tax=Brevibacillus aydinogluensis TaxID=927786 RepID=A0AA48MBE0_9BACL|nr:MULTISPECIES: Holliday junction branch migration protein RuvA [Bacillales]REK64526.1 MAG: Holliday junction branch migration protein RuvA [Brevibacillus sp.]MBR8660615.1 Holliday junction branch migration protein RuvA [Brevibacillus sp. NL20B1]MDT3414396.1 Holliday junction DNA helicase RuvA [Brevibacillus aydinogluensis]NNV02589.1 Holliday junction branch migration protein RuvA [Brevibacillus sp. MCWH]UFJ59984.1 Holliday junction branch migration protein RuvA [Anoxybacillus sediminis]
MIDFVEGTLAYLDAEYIVIEAGGIGYRLFCPNPYQFVRYEGTKTRLYTHHHVREDAILLYGFATREERDLYRKLLDVNGIGPKGALSILAAATPEQIVMAVQQENVSYLTKFPGIGKKTAQRMILDLKDKLTGYTPSAVMAVAATELAAGEKAASALQEAQEALTALGYSDAELQSIRGALSEAAKGGAPVEQLIKQGLALLMRG